MTSQHMHIMGHLVGGESCNFGFVESHFLVNVQVTIVITLVMMYFECQHVELDIIHHMTFYNKKTYVSLTMWFRTMSYDFLQKEKHTVMTFLTRNLTRKRDFSQPKSARMTALKKYGKGFCLF